MNPSYQHYATHDESEYPELWDGCVGAWASCLGPSGTRLHDHSGRANWGTLTGMDPATDWVVDGGRYALDFDGLNDFAQFDTTYPQTIFQPFSVVVWQKGFLGLSRWKRLVADGWIFIDVVIGTPRVGFGYIGAPGNGTWAYTSLPYDRNVMSCFVATADGTGTTAGQKIYIDGFARQTTVIGSGTAIIEPSTKLRYGGTDGTAAYFASVLGEIRIYDRVLSADESRLVAMRPGIAYTPRRRSKAYSFGPSFNPAWARGANQFVQPSMIGVA